MNSRPNTYISEDAADVIAKLAEKDDLVMRAEAALEGVTDGPWTEHDKGRHPNAYVCGATENYEHGDDQPVVAYIVGMNVEANRRFIAFTRQWVPEAVAHIVALTEQSAELKAESLEFKAKADERAEMLTKELVLQGSSLNYAELQIQMLQQEVEEIRAAAKIVSAAADRHYNNALQQHNIAELRTNQLDDAYARIKTLDTALTEAHSMLLWCERRMMSPSIATYPKELALKIEKILYE